jgi:hypothetical protein
LILDDVDGVNEKLIWNVFYHFRVDEASLDLLRLQTTKLISVSTSLKSWKESKYGQYVKLCDRVSLEMVRDMWRFYGAKREGDDLRSYKTKVESSMKKSQEYMKSVTGNENTNVITGIRAAAPACLQAVPDLGGLYRDYWKFGTTDTDAAARSQAIEYNPLFVPQDGNMFLHYGTDPLLGFHLGLSYAPIESTSPLSSTSTEKPTPLEIVKNAQREFNSWMKSFRAHSSAGLVTLRFFVGDAVAFAYSLQHVGTAGSSKSARWYRDRYHFGALELDNQDYLDDSAPSAFDVIDTSNLIDHLGGLNLLAATSPLLRSNFSATLYSENLVRAQENHKELLDNLLCGDSTTVSSLLGLTPVEVATNTASVSSGDEALCQSMTDSSKAGQSFARIAWKRPLNPTGTTSNFVGLIHFDPAHLAHALFRVFTKMFADEDVTHLLARMQSQGTKRPTLPIYHRASFVAFLCLVKSRVQTDWNQTMEALLHHMDDDSSLAFATTYMQELTLWMHMMGLYTVDILKSPPNSSASPQDTGTVKQWQNIPAVVSVILQVPRHKIDPFIKQSIEKGITPPLQAILQSSPQAANQWQNMFAATQIGFGTLRTEGAQHSDTFNLRIDEDQLKWSGKSSMFVSFYVPSWILLQEPRTATVSLAIPHSPHTVAAFARSLGPNLSIFSAEQQDAGHVYITKAMPHQSKVISICGFAPGNVRNEVDPEGNWETKVTASVDQNGHISFFTSHVQILSEEAKVVLKEGSNVSRAMQSPFNHTLSIEGGPTYKVNFPVPVLNSTAKIRIARKSSYLELVADVAKLTDWSSFQSFMYPVFMDSGLPAPWSMPKINLSTLPAMDVTDSSSVRLKWLQHHLPTMWSAQECALKLKPTLPAPPNLRSRVEFKDSLYHMFIGFSGIQGQKASVFNIDCAEEKGVQMVFFLSKMRLDLSNRTVVLDAAVLPLTLDLMPIILPSLQAMSGSKFAPKSIRTPKYELQLWKEALPAWTERCRTWSHKPGCEYASTGNIPLSTNFGERVLCSCGEGNLPTNFMPDFPGWKGLAKYAVRVAVSPAFASALVDNPLDQSAFGTPKGEPATAKDAPIPTRQAAACLVCRKSMQPDGSELMNCSRCHIAKYCSKECQRADWKKHKGVCKGEK